MNKKMKILLINPEVPNTFWSLEECLEIHFQKGAAAAVGAADGRGDAAEIVWRKN